MAEPYLDADGGLIPEQAWRSFVEGLERNGSERLPLEHVPLRPERRRRLLEGLQHLLFEAVRKRLPRATASAAAGAIGRGFLRASDSVGRSAHRRGSQGGGRGGDGMRVGSSGARVDGGDGVSDAKLGLLFSGGVDSTLIAFLLKRLGVPFTCITVGFQDGESKEPEDVVESRRIAHVSGYDHVVVMLDLAQMHELVKRTVAILGPDLTNVVNAGVGAVEVAAIEKGKTLGISRFFGGLGSEELFAGYDRHEKALEKGGFEALHKECLNGLKGMYQRDLRRDAVIAKKLSVTVATPFLDEELIKFSLTIPPEYKINTNEQFIGRTRGDVPDERTVKKLILREAAEAMGLPHDLAFRPKRAAQYGSRTNNALTTLRRLHGHPDKEAYLRSFEVKP